MARSGALCKMTNPAIPGNTKDRTGGSRIIKRAMTEIDRRFKGLQGDVLALFDAIPVYVLNALADPGPRVLYGLTPSEMTSLSAELQAALERWIASGRDPAHLFWWSPYAEESAQMGTAQSVANLDNLSTAYAASRTLEAVVYSEPYRNRLAMAQIKSYEHWTGLAAAQKSELAQIIGRAVVDGKNPKAVRTEIMDRLEVTRSKAAQYAQTDITDTLRQARWAEAEYAADAYQLKIGLLWTSALKPTTRPWHASRNGKVFKPEDVRQWYGQDGNRYNCYLPGTIVSGRFVAGSKARYKGPIVTLMTTDGRKLAVTTNHPVMTSNGLVAAAEIKVGDKLVAYGHQIKNTTRIADLNGGHVGARIEDVFGALVDSGHELFARVSGIDFHGDAAFMDKNIHVVRSDRMLTFALDTAGGQFLDDLALVHPNPARTGFSLEQSFGETGNAPPCGGVGIGDSGLFLGSCVVGAPDNLGILDASVSQPQILEALADVTAIKSGALGNRKDGFPGDMGCVQRGNDGGTLFGQILGEPEAASVKPDHQGSIANADTLGDVLERFAGLAALDEVVDVSFGYFDGHVYDLQEVSGLMISNSITASNCYCGQSECLLDADGKPILTDRLKASMLAEKLAWEKANLP